MRQAAQPIEAFRVRRSVDGFDAASSLGQAPSLLIADDDAAVVGLLSHHFARLGFEVDTASDGLQAFLKATRGKPSVLVIDVNMPELDGLSVCGHLLDADRAPANVIIITGSNNQHTLQRCERVGTRHVRKGPDFWKDLDAALLDMDPRIARRMRRTTC
ncbi:response regulator [Bradyrhizobium sp. HKCCYLR20261]|uniref:response regulator n=1 Tax=Bradyrhizobium sp. HKCCYLR20261 TaxID=3420760 RepID=UPI003EB74263